MEKAIKNKVAKAVVPAIDVMFQALRWGISLVYLSFHNLCLHILHLNDICLDNESVNLGQR